MVFKLNTIRYRLDYNTFRSATQTEHSYTIQFSDNGYDWYDLEDEFPENVGQLIIEALESANFIHFDDLRPKWTNN